jgi:hypothetical protein
LAGALDVSFRIDPGAADPVIAIQDERWMTPPSGIRLVG